MSCDHQDIILDQQLSKLISKQLDITDRALNKSDLLLLTELEIKDIEIRSLKGMKECINLNKLILQNCSLSNISDIKYLTSLKYLNIALNPQINDITPIGYLSNLEVFLASGNNIDNIKPLENNYNLRRLYLNNTKKIMDISPLSKLTELRVLEFYDNQISDIAPVSNLINLERFWCNQNKISDISPIHSLTNLKYLLLSNNTITDLEPLSELKKLTILDFSYNNVSNISVIYDLIQYGAFTDTSYKIWWEKDIDNSPLINIKSNSINLTDDKINIETVELIKTKEIALIYN